MTPFYKKPPSLPVLIPRFTSQHEENGLLLVRGPKCSGKTTFLSRISDSAAGSGALILWATCWPSEHELPFYVLRQVLDQLEEAGEAAMTPAEILHTTNREEDSRWAVTIVHEQVYRRLLDVAARRPLLIAVDDINHVDLPSQDFLRFLARRLKGTRIKLVLAEQTGQTVCHSSGLRTDVMRLPYTQVVRLGLLSREQLAKRIGEHADVTRDPAARTATERIAAHIHDLTGGNVLLAGLLSAKYLAAAGRGGNEPTVDGDFYETVRIMIDGSGIPGISRGARAAAVLGRFCSPQRLARLLNGDPVSAECVLRGLEDLGMMHGTRLREQIGLALIDDQNFPELTELHLKAAHILFNDGVSVEYVAQNLTAAGKIEKPWDLPLVLALIGRTLEEDTTDVVDDLLTLTQASTLTADECSAVEMLLLRNVWLKDPALAATLVSPLVAAARRGTLGLADLAFLVRATALLGFPDHASELMSMLRERPSEPGAQSEVMLAEVLYSFWHSVLPRHPRTDLHVPAEPPSPWASAKQSDVLAMCQHAWLQTVQYKVPDLLKSGDRAGAIFVAEQILEGVQLKRSGVEPFLVACWVLESVNALPLARKWCIRLSEALVDHPSPVWKALLSAVQAMTSAALGDLADAYRLLQEALAHKPWDKWGALTGLIGGVLVGILTEMGRYEEAADVLDRPLHPSVFQGLCSLHYVRARGRHHLALGRLHAAVADFESCRDASAYLNVELPLVVPWRCDMAEAYLKMGNVQGARALLDEQLSLLPEGETAIHGATLRLLARTHEADQRICLLKMSADELEACGSRLELAHTLTELAFAYREISRLNLARMAMRRAQRMAQQCDAGRLQQLITVDTASSTARDEGPVESHTELDKLSSAERRVALLAIQGHTNREISAKLFITPSTVEQHLTRIYRKLRVQRRDDLENRFSSVFVGADCPM